MPTARRVCPRGEDVPPHSLSRAQSPTGPEIISVLYARGGADARVTWRGWSFLCASHLPSCLVWDPQQHVSGVGSAQPPEARYVTWDCCALGLVSARGSFLGCSCFATGSLLNMTYRHLSVFPPYSHNTPRLAASCFAVAESQAAARPGV